MNEQLSATIIPFPGKMRPLQMEASVPVLAAAAIRRVPAPATPSRAGDLAHSSQRLTTALANLSAALADQKEATQRWKTAIEDLAIKMRTLGDVSIGQKKIS